MYYCRSQTEIDDDAVQKAHSSVLNLLSHQVYDLTMYHFDKARVDRRRAALDQIRVQLESVILGESSVTKEFSFHSLSPASVIGYRIAAALN